MHTNTIKTAFTGFPTFLNTVRLSSLEYSLFVSAHLKNEVICEKAFISKQTTIQKIIKLQNSLLRMLSGGSMNQKPIKIITAQISHLIMHFKTLFFIFFSNTIQIYR